MNENIKKLEDEKEEHTMIGFEIVFPLLIQLARKLEIKVADDSHVLKEIYARRDLKLAKSVSPHCSLICVLNQNQNLELPIILFSFLLKGYQRTNCTTPRQVSFIAWKGWKIWNGKNF